MNRSKNNKRNTKKVTSESAYNRQDLKKEKRIEFKNQKTQEKHEVTKMSNFYYSFEIETDDIFSKEENKKILSYTLIKANSQPEAEENVRLLYEQRNLPIYKLIYLGLEQV